MELYAATYYVSQGGSDTPPYTNWTMASQTIQPALDYARHGDMVLIGGGTYSITNTLHVQEGVTMEGRGNPGDEVIIDAGGQCLAVYLGRNSRIAAFTVQRGSGQWQGGGIRAEPGAQISHCVITNNFAYQGGGVNFEAEGFIENCSVYNNLASRAGGIIIKGGTVSNCLVQGNISEQAGGGIVVDGGGLVTHCQVLKNSATNGGGGGILLDDGGVVVWTKLDSNSATFDGGGIRINNSGRVSLCTISNNTAISGGGAALRSGGIIETCLIVNNQALQPPVGYGGDGGGLRLQSGGNVRNCLIRGNRGRTAGGIDFWTDPGGTIGSVQNCTIVENISTSYYAGGVWAYRGCNVKNSIIVSNYNRSGIIDAVATDGGNASFTYNCIDEEVTGIGNITNNPCFVNAIDGNFRLAPGSACINAGMNSAWMAESKDLDGNERLQGCIVDMGCYENFASTPGLSCSIAATPTDGTDYMEVNLLAIACGPDNVITSYWWDMENDGSFEYIGPEHQEVVHTYGVGRHDVKLRVWNSSGEVAETTEYNLVNVRPSSLPNIYVSAGGLSVYPYTNWFTAATNIHDAVTAAATTSTIWVSDGIYPGSFSSR